MTGGSEFNLLSFAAGLVAGATLVLLIKRRRNGRLEIRRSVQPVDLPEDIKPVILLYRADGRVIDAVKLVRERTGCDLQTAKHLVEQLR